MDKILNRISNLILLVTIAASYLMWVVGIGTKTTSFIYVNSVYLLAAAIMLVLLLKVKELTKSDWVYSFSGWHFHLLLADLFIET